MGRRMMKINHKGTPAAPNHACVGPIAPYIGRFAKFLARAFSGKVESGGIPKEARIGFKIPTGARGPVMNGEAILR